MLNTPRRFVDKTGMYRVVSGGLSLLVLFSLIGGVVGWVPYSLSDQIVALGIALVIALILNYGITTITKIPSHPESAIITALISYFLVIPGDTVTGNWPLALAVAIGILSKFLVVYKKQHLFNPAAFGAVVLSATGVYVFSWWVSNPALFAPLIVVGVLVVMKVRKWAPVLAFIGVGYIVFVLESLTHGESMIGSTVLFFVSWPTLFLAFFMLTEPFTLPSTKRMQIIYGALVGFLANTTVFSPVFSMTPELALILGNLSVIPYRLHQKLFLTLREKRVLAKDTMEFVFEKPVGFRFVPGQYLEWMLPHSKPDKRGIRRYFTIASSPTETDIRIALKIPEKASSFKRALTTLGVGHTITGSQCAGDFVLPRKSTKVGFIAGGIGITPFRSHLQWMLDTNTQFDTVLYYCNNTQAEIAYQELLEEAQRRMPCTVVHVVAQEKLTSPYEHGFITEEMLKRRTPDYRERVWFISGPPIMVTNYSSLLRKLGVSSRHIVKDFFPGAV